MKRKQAILFGLTHYNTGKPCKHGHNADRRVKDRVCMACDRDNKKTFAKNNKNVLVERKKQFYEKNRESILLQKQEYRKVNKGKINALVAKRKTHIKQRVAKWLSKDDNWIMKEIYDLAAKRTKMHGFKWHVDHIIPLQGKFVSGLHIPENLQVIPWIDNVRKKNKFEVTHV